MNTSNQEKHIASHTDSDRSRLQAIQERLRRGDKKRIAELAGVHRVWVSYVLSGAGTSEPVLQAAEQLISEREKQTN